LLTLTRACLDAVDAAGRKARLPRGGIKLTKRQTRTAERLRWLEHDLYTLSRALRAFEELLQGSASRAADRGALLLLGEAGQGKTHLFCDVGTRAVEAERPAVVLFGAQFSGRRAWSGVAEQLGLGNIGSERLIQGMRAAAEASNAPFLVLLDALNEAAPFLRHRGEQ
jgi:hypothetical protein